MRIFTKIVLPLGKPILVTIGTFSGLAYWNDWTNGLYYINKKTGTVHDTEPAEQDGLRLTISVAEQWQRARSDLRPRYPRCPAAACRWLSPLSPFFPSSSFFPSSRSTIPRALHWARLRDKKTGQLNPRSCRPELGKKLPAARKRRTYVPICI